MGRPSEPPKERQTARLEIGMTEAELEIDRDGSGREDFYMG
jgi:hypothetical protein